MIVSASGSLYSDKTDLSCSSLYKHLRRDDAIFVLDVTPSYMRLRWNWDINTPDPGEISTLFGV